MTSADPQTIHARLGSAFYDVVTPARFPDHILRYRNQQAATQIGLDCLSDDEFINHFGRFAALPGSLLNRLHFGITDISSVPITLNWAMGVDFCLLNI